jgi:hypothetical protein
MVRGITRASHHHRSLDLGQLLVQRVPEADLLARGALAVGEEFRTEGVLGGVFRCGIARETSIGDVAGIVPRIGGRAWITGYARYVLQDDDPFHEGFIMGDIWPAANAGSTAERLAEARRVD